MQTALFASAAAEVLPQAEEPLSGFQVKVNGVALVDLLQMFHLGRRSVTLKLHGGTLHIREGEVIHAEYGNTSGEAAVRQMLELRGGELETDDLGPTPVSVRRPLASVLLDALVALDEEQLGVAPPAANDRAEETPPIYRTRSAQLDAICAHIVDHVAGAMGCVIVDVNRSELVGCDPTTQLSAAAHEELLEIALDQFSANRFGALEHELGEGAQSDATLEVCFYRGPYSYVGKRLNDSSVVLVLTKSTQAPEVALHELRAAVSRSTRA